MTEERTYWLASIARNAVAVCSAPPISVIPDTAQR